MQTKQKQKKGIIPVGTGLHEKKHASKNDACQDGRMGVGMKKEKILRSMKKLFFLPPIPTILISVPSFLLVIYALAWEGADPVIKYAAYILSAYALVIVITGIIRLISVIRTGIDKHPFVQRMLRIPFLRNYLEEPVFRAKAALYQGLFINFAYAGFKLFSGIYYRSLWFGALAGYYAFLAVMRFLLLHHVRKEKNLGENKLSEWHRYRLCGVILLFMNQALVGIIVLVVHQNSGFEYPGMLIYVMAMYAFYAVIIAVRNVVKFRKYGSPVLSAAKTINLTAAAVSMLSLETAMLTQFGAAEDADFRQIMTGATGAGVSLIVLSMAVYMIVHATKQMKQEKQGGAMYGEYTGGGG